MIPVLTGLSEFIGGLLMWGGMLAAPVAAGAVVFNITGNVRSAILAAAVVFSAFLGWNARSLLADAQESAALERALRDQARLQSRLVALSERVEQDRETIRRETDDAISAIQRASALADMDGARDHCVLTPDELDGLWDAFGVDGEKD